MIKYLDLPPLPPYIVEQLLLMAIDYKHETKLPGFDKMSINERMSDQIMDYDIDDPGLGEPFETAYKYEGLAEFIMIKVDGPIRTWVEQNIDANIGGLHIQVIDGKFVFPHVDMLRKRAWNYLIETADADTCFYAPKEEFKLLPAKPRTYIPYERVDLISSEKIEPGRWHELAVENIHGVENINGTRIALSISFPD